MNRKKRSRRYAPAPRIDDPNAWGIWDRYLRGWVERPHYVREGVERIAKKLTRVHADGAAEAGAEDPVWFRGFPFLPSANPDDPAGWGIWDKNRERWAEPTIYCEDHAQELASVFNETYATGLAEAMIEKARRR